MRRAGAAALGVLALLAAGCGDDPRDPVADPSSTTSTPAAWQQAEDPVDPTGLVWSSGATVHLADGTTITLAAEPASYVVAGGGVFHEVHGQDAVQYADAGGTDDTGLTLVPGTLSASPDGRFVGGIDAEIGEPDQFGTPVATVRVFDLQTGEEVLTTSEGMGDPASDDLSVLYEDSSLDLRLTDGTAYVDDATGAVQEHDLGTGAPDPPTTEWEVVDRPGLQDRLRGPDGRLVTPDTGTDRWLLDAFLDASTVVGVAVEGPGDGSRVGPQDTTTLMSCTVPSGACDLVPASTGQEVSFPETSGIAGFVLQEGS